MVSVRLTARIWSLFSLSISFRMRLAGRGRPRGRSRQFLSLRCCAGQASRASRGTPKDYAKGLCHDDRWSRKPLAEAWRPRGLDRSSRSLWRRQHVAVEGWTTPTQACGRIKNHKGTSQLAGLHPISNSHNVCYGTSLSGPWVGIADWRLTPHNAAERPPSAIQVPSLCEQDSLGGRLVENIERLAQPELKNAKDRADRRNRETQSP